MGFMSDLNDFVKKVSKAQGKNVYNLFLYLVVGILAVLLGSLFLSEKQAPNIISKPEKVQVDENNKITLQDYKERLEKQLESILTQVKGVGNVKVMMTLNSGVEIIPAYNTNETFKTTQEKDDQGGERVISENIKNHQLVVVNETGGKNKPVIIKEMKPKIKGVIIVAEGAQDPVIKSNILKAVKTVLDLPAYKVTVLTKK